MTIDPFLIPLPRKIGEDPELAPYFNFLGKVVHDLTRIRDAVEDAGAISSITGYTPHASGATTVTSNAATDLDTTAAALDVLVSEVATLAVEVGAVRTQLNALLQSLRDHGDLPAS